MPENKSNVCPVCNGTGQETYLTGGIEPIRMPGYSPNIKMRPCPECNGTGKVTESSHDIVPSETPNPNSLENVSGETIIIRGEEYELSSFGEKFSDGSRAATLRLKGTK